MGSAFELGRGRDVEFRGGGCSGCGSGGGSKGLQLCGGRSEVLLQCGNYCLLLSKPLLKLGESFSDVSHVE